MPIEDELLARWGAATLEERLASKLREYHQLIPRESALMLLSLELNGSQARPESISAAMRSPYPSLLRARALRVFPARRFEKDGGRSANQRLSLSDQSGTGTLVLYDAACAPADREVLAGDLVEAGPVRYRAGEFHLQPGGALKRLQKGPRAKVVDPDPSASPIGHFEGAVSAFFGDFPYRKGQSKLSGEGPSSLMSAFELSDAGGKARVVLWDSPGLSGQLPVGRPVEIENGVRRGGEIHINSTGRLLLGPRLEKPRPKIERLELGEKDGAPILSVRASDSRLFVFPTLDEAAARLGTGPIPDGLDARTLIELKKDAWVGQELPEAWERFAANTKA